MKRWISSRSEQAEVPEIDAFIEDIKEVYQRHGLAISHEDFHGAFEIVRLDSAHIKWLEDAHDDITPQ